MFVSPPRDDLSVKHLFGESKMFVSPQSLHQTFEGKVMCSFPKCHAIKFWLLTNQWEVTTCDAFAFSQALAICR